MLSRPRTTTRHTAVLVLLLAGCSRLACRGPERIPFATCREFRPALATSHFDGRTGQLALRNASRHWIDVHLYEPGDAGAISLRRAVGPGALLVPAGPDGVPVVLGSDWGVQIGRSCVRTLGETAEWSDRAFTLTWRSNGMRPGLSTGPRSGP